MSNPDKPVFEFHVAPPEKQNRWGVLLRIFVAIPQAVFAVALTYAAVLLTFFAWFYMIFTGRNPYHAFNSKALRAYQRYSGYICLLTSTYPPFSLEEDPDYALTSELEQGQLVRMKVLFRIILVIPVLIVAWILSFGILLMVIFSWFALLVRGTLPKTVHYAIAACIRFQGRVSAYLLLLQDPYPRGLFGDKASTLDVNELPEAEIEGTEPTPSPAPVSELSMPEPPSSEEVAAPFRSMPPPHLSDVEATNMEDRSDATRSWLLTLSAGTKRLIVVAMILGAVAGGLYTAFVPKWNFQANGLSSVSASTWNSNYRSDVINLRNAVSGFQSAFDAKHPNWTTVTNDCVALQNQYNVFDDVPYYPQVGPDQNLLSGLRAIYSGFNGCVTIIAPYKVAKALPYLTSQFETGTADLKTFLQQT
jgi:hypothetical protein